MFPGRAEGAFSPSAISGLLYRLATLRTKRKQDIVTARYIALISGVADMSQI
jgi:hypothetical protein